MIDAEWLNIGDTAIYMIKFNIGEIPEWHPVGQVVLRQIHPGTLPRWYAYGIGNQASNYFIGHYASKGEAVNSIENKDY